MRIAMLADATSSLELFHDILALAGHECQHFSDNATLLREVRKKSFNLLILDGHTTDCCNMSVLKTIRHSFISGVPVLLVSQQAEDQGSVAALKAGADDVMARPIRADVLEARAQALLRRAYPRRHARALTFGRYRFLPELCALEVDGRTVDLKYREYELAFFLFRHLGQLVTRQQLHDAVWGTRLNAASRSLDTHISRLRSKLDLRPANGFLLSATYALGYRLEAFGEPVVAALPARHGGALPGRGDTASQAHPCARYSPAP